ncbi:uncharacterized protein UHOD_11190 [Ustilago sp. UG-2017b]|nr:uncharacterized protein UHOD_11190 [Ustilago sp. UG-2017b]
MSGVARLRPGSGEVARHDQYQYEGDGEVGSGDDTVGGVVDKAGGIGGKVGGVDTSVDTYASEVILVICVTSDAAPALSPESTFFIEYCAGGPSSATPVLLSCVASFDTAPPPQDLLAGLLYTAPPPSTGDGSSGSYLPSP